MAEKELTLEEIHEETLKLYKTIEKICDEIGINCFTIYGTLLGTVRHKGYIPWDDDFDIVMMRPDYDRFCAWCKEQGEALLPYRLSNGFEDTDLGFTISRFCDTRFRYETLNHKEVKKLGLFIDIYPYDGLGCDREEALQTMKDRIPYEKCLSVAYSKRMFDFSQGVAFGLLRAVTFLCTRLISKKYLIHKIWEITTRHRFEDSTIVGLVIWGYNTVLFDKSWFDEKVVMPFEDTTVYAPKGYEAFLTTFFGDYMQLPPEEKRKPYHGYYLYRRG